MILITKKIILSVQLVTVTGNAICLIDETSCSRFAVIIYFVIDNCIGITAEQAALVWACAAKR